MSGSRERDPDPVPDVHDTDRMEVAGEASEETEVATLMGERELNMAGGSDPGQVRELNEDSWRHEVFDEDFALAAVAVTQVLRVRVRFARTIERVRLDG